MRARVAFTGIRLDLGNLNGHSAIVIGALKDAAKYFRCDIEHLARKKPAVRQMKSSQQGHLVSVSTPGGQRSNETSRVFRKSMLDQGQFSEQGRDYERQGAAGDDAENEHGYCTGDG